MPSSLSVATVRLDARSMGAPSAIDRTSDDDDDMAVEDERQDVLVLPMLKAE